VTPVVDPPRPPGRPRVVDPAAPFRHYATVFGDGTRRVPCARRGCRYRLHRDARVFCSPECRDHVALRAAFILECAGSAPPGTVYMDVLRGGFLKRSWADAIAARLERPA
jgi:hypothetical protein